MEYYYEILSFHIIAVISWMSALFYMPRLFVYHAENINNQSFCDVVKIQEKMLYKAITLPAMMASLLSGLLMIYLKPDILSQTWMWGKLFLLILMIIFSFSLSHYKKQFAKNNCQKNGQFFRAYNEIPTLLTIFIVVFVITKNINWYFVVLVSLFFAFIVYKVLNKNKAPVYKSKT